MSRSTAVVPAGPRVAAGPSTITMPISVLREIHRARTQGEFTHARAQIILAPIGMALTKASRLVLLSAALFLHYTAVAIENSYAQNIGKQKRLLVLTAQNGVAAGILPISFVKGADLSSEAEALLSVWKIIDRGALEPAVMERVLMTASTFRGSLKDMKKWVSYFEFLFKKSSRMVINWADVCDIIGLIGEAIIQKKGLVTQIVTLVAASAGELRLVYDKQDAAFDIESYKANLAPRVCKEGLQQVTTAAVRKPGKTCTVSEVREKAELQVRKKHGASDNNSVVICRISRPHIMQALSHLAQFLPSIEDLAKLKGTVRQKAVIDHVLQLLPPSVATRLGQEFVFEDFVLPWDPETMQGLPGIQRLAPFTNHPISVGPPSAAYSEQLHWQPLSEGSDKAIVSAVMPPVQQAIQTVISKSPNELSSGSFGRVVRTVKVSTSSGLLRNVDSPPTIAGAVLIDLPVVDGSAEPLRSLSPHFLQSVFARDLNQLVKKQFAVACSNAQAFRPPGEQAVSDQDGYGEYMAFSTLDSADLHVSVSKIHLESALSTSYVHHLNGRAVLLLFDWNLMVALTYLCNNLDLADPVNMRNSPDNHIHPFLIAALTKHIQQSDVAIEPVRAVTLMEPAVVLLPSAAHSLVKEVGPSPAISIVGGGLDARGCVRNMMLVLSGDLQGSSRLPVDVDIILMLDESLKLFYAGTVQFKHSVVIDLAFFLAEMLCVFTFPSISQPPVDLSNAAESKLDMQLAVPMFATTDVMALGQIPARWHGRTDKSRAKLRVARAVEIVALAQAFYSNLNVEPEEWICVAQGLCSSRIFAHDELSLCVQCLAANIMRAAPCAFTAFAAAIAVQVAFADE